MVSVESLERKLINKKEEIDNLKKQVQAFTTGTRQDYIDELGILQKGTRLPMPFNDYLGSGGMIVTLANLTSGALIFYKKEFEMKLSQAQSEINNIQAQLSIEKQKEELLKSQSQTFYHSQVGGTGTLDIGSAPVVIPTPTPLVTEPEPVIIQQPIVTATPIITPTVDDSINTNMVTQQVINFNIVNGRAVGSIKFIATNNFNSYYYGKDIINLVQFKTPNGITLLVKQNRLHFTETERDEIINYDESVQDNTRVIVESFVWEWIDKPLGGFSNKYTIEISEAEPPKPTQAGFMGAGVAGAIAGLILLGFIADHKRTK